MWLLRDTTGSRARSRAARLAIVPTLLAAAGPIEAQPPVAAPYRPPSIALVQPSGVGTVPRDRPIVVFRFAAGESDDPIDATSFAVTVDGLDRTGRFQVTGDEAWGSLAASSATDSLLAPGPKAVIARVCSIRGACAMTGVTVTVDPSTMSGDIPPAASAGARKSSSRTRRIARVLDALRTILMP